MTGICTRAALVLAIGSIGAVPAAASPSVALAPATGHPKITTQVSGSGFGANEAVDIYFDTTDMLLGTTDGSGNFGKYPLRVPADAQPGTHWITAIGRKSGDAGQKTFTVRTNWAEMKFAGTGKSYDPYENVISSANIAQLGTAWIAATGGAIDSSPVVAASRVYTASSDGKVYAFDAATGTSKWTASTGGAIYSSPAFANGIVYAGSSDRKLYAFNAYNGAQKWTATTGGAISASPTVSAGIVYVGSGDGKLYAFDAATGASKWSVATGNAIDSSPAIANGIVYAGSTDFNLYAIGASTGATLWTAATGGAIESSPAVADGIVFVGSDDGGLHLFSAISGDDLGPFSGDGGPVIQSPAFANGVLYFSDYDGSGNTVLHAVPLGSGRGWSQVNNAGIFTSPIFANNVLYIAQNIPSLNQYAITGADPATGNPLWISLTGGYVNAPPVLADGMLYMGSEDGNLYAYALDAGNDAVYHRNPSPPSFARLHPDLRLKPARPIQ